MTDYYFKADNEQELWNTLISAGLVQYVTEDGVTYKVPTNGNSLDVIGLIYEPTGNTLTDPEMGEYPEMAPLPGYHANMRGTIDEPALTAISAILIPAPAAPVRVWA